MRSETERPSVDLSVGTETDVEKIVGKLLTKWANMLQSQIVKDV